jgi:hypothetical protein
MFVVITEDPSVDVAVELFTDEQAARDYAKLEAEKLCERKDIDICYNSAYILMLICGEGDGLISVVEREVK